MIDEVDQITPDELKKAGIRVSIFVDANQKIISEAAKIGADRVELYTEPYASQFPNDREKAIADYIVASEKYFRTFISLCRCFRRKYHSIAM